MSDQGQFSPNFYCASDLRCQLFDESSKSIEIYCEGIEGELPINCLGTGDLSRGSKDHRSDEEPECQVSQLKVRGCNTSSTQTTIKSIPSLTSIDISNSKYESLAEFNLTQTHLLHINASYNELSMIPVRFLIGVQGIVEFDFSYNKLQRIESNAFEGAIELMRIFLSNNEISYIADDAFTNLTNLEYVDLNNNRFHWCDMFRNNKQLKTLLMADAPIFNIDCNHFLKMSSVYVLVSWKHVRYLNTNCDGTQFHVFLNSDHHDAVLPAQREIYCTEQSLERIQQFTAGRSKIENVEKMLQCFGSSLREIDLAGNFMLSNPQFHRS